MYSSILALISFFAENCKKIPIVCSYDLQMFSNFDEYAGEKDVDRQVVSMFQQHLQSGIFWLLLPIAKRSRALKGITYPFVANIEDSNLNINEKESLFDLSRDDSLKTKFQSSLSRSHFWLSIKNEYLSLNENLVQFSSTYLCKRHFHSM